MECTHSAVPGIKVVELEGAVDFITRLGKYGLAPDEKRQELQS